MVTICNHNIVLKFKINGKTHQLVNSSVLQKDFGNCMTQKLKIKWRKQ